jgi:hypothetical protein
MKPRPQRRSGNFSALKVEVWAAIREASAVLSAPETTPELKLRAVSAIATAAAVYAKLLESTPAADETPELPGEVIVIRSTTGSNGHHG